MQQIREYKIIEKIGEGGMGEVFLAEDENLGRMVAIKALAPELLRNSELIERFKQEARVQASLIHPNIVSLFTFFSEQNSMYMVLEYAPGKTLKEEIKQLGVIEESKALLLLHQILEGVGYAHQKGIVHRDLKPSNIMLDENDAVKIMDFGIAKVLGDRGMTKTGTKMGTIYYMSPEQIRAAKDIDQRTDIYSLGIVLYEMLTGRVPFNTNTESDFEIMNEIVNNSFPDVRKYNPSVSEITAKVIDKMIAKQKEERYATCYQCGIDLTCEKVKKEETPKPKVIIEPEMVLVKSGSFQRETTNALGLFKKIHTLTLDSFYIGKYPVTQKEWKEIMESNPSHFKGDDLPVERVNRNDVQEYLKKLNTKTGKTYRLPTEAEWEYAARGGASSAGYTYSGSNNLDDVGWYAENSDSKTHTVGTRQPNELGIYDMSGNVWEWCSDWYDENYYKSSPGRNPQGPESGTMSVLRGGSWFNLAYACRSAYRNGNLPDVRYSDGSFRLAHDK